jgi:histidinol-phosphatase (PHP family)
MFRGCADRTAGLARRRLADIVGPIDLTNVCGDRPTTDLARETGAALDAACAAGMAVEVNTNGWRTPSREAYPEPVLLRACPVRHLSLIFFEAVG